MTSPSLEIQGVFIAALKADAATSALADGVYDQPPVNPWAGPNNAYISWGPTDIVQDDADEITSENHSVQIDVWSRANGSVQCKRICDAVKRALHEQQDSLVFADNALVEVEMKSCRILRDPDGLTTHGVMTFSVMIEES